MQKIKLALLLEVGSMIALLLGATGLAFMNPMVVYTSPEDNVWGVRTNDIIQWTISDNYGLNTVDTAAKIDYSGVFENITRIATEDQTKYTVLFYNTSYLSQNLKIHFEYTNGTGETLEKVYFWYSLETIFDSIYSDTIEYDLETLSGSTEFDYEITSLGNPYEVNVRFYVETNETTEHFHLYGEFLVEPVITTNFESFGISLNAEIIKIEDATTDDDNFTDVFLMSKYIMTEQGIAIDIPDYLDTGIIVWILGLLTGWGKPNTLFIPSSMRIVTSMVPYVIMGNQSFSFRTLELFTFYNFYMLPTNFNWTVLSNFGELLNDLFGGNIVIDIEDTSEELSLFIKPNAFPVIEDMMFGNTSASVKIAWDKSTGLLKELGLYLNYFNIGMERDISILLSYTTMPEDDYPDPPEELDIQPTLFWASVGIITGLAIASGALLLSLYHFIRNYKNLGNKLTLKY